MLGIAEYSELWKYKRSSFSPFFSPFFPLISPFFLQLFTNIPKRRSRLVNDVNKDEKVNVLTNEV